MVLRKVGSSLKVLSTILKKEFYERLEESLGDNFMEFKRKAPAQVGYKYRQLP